MKTFSKCFAKLLSDDSGGEVLEYALIMGLILLACIATITSLGGKVFARWSSTDAAL